GSIRSSRRNASTGSSSSASSSESSSTAVSSTAAAVSSSATSSVASTATVSRSSTSPASAGWSRGCSDTVTCFLVAVRGAVGRGSSAAERLQDELADGEVEEPDVRHDDQHEHDDDDRVRRQFLAGRSDDLAQLGDDLADEEHDRCDRTAALILLLGGAAGDGGALGRGAAGAGPRRALLASALRGCRGDDLLLGRLVDVVDGILGGLVRALDGVGRLVRDLVRGIVEPTIVVAGRAR